MLPKTCCHRNAKTRTAKGRCSDIQSSVPTQMEKETLRLRAASQGILGFFCEFRLHPAQRFLNAVKGSCVPEGIRSTTPCLRSLNLQVIPLSLDPGF
ncbi:hypothetical protein NDU88_001416 [Pleurodeles waltl]|uniref:Uncharacterized protein n=1 Tax=Pleurodeles waltl TaxID=8319 RepID=A0AAV7UUL8_PLEWA|nr:hypothetical protein NDU88_001416 [Pleurodeles waltl]